MAFSGNAFPLEKCIGPDGRVTYSDRGCAAGAKKTTVGGGSFGEAAIEYYDVGAPGGHAAHSTWYVTYRYRPRSVPGGGCTVQSVDTKLSLKVRMPRWNAPANADPKLLEHWNRYLGALEVHENGHLQHGRDLAGNFKRAALATRARDCGDLERSLRQRFDAMVKDAAALDVQYDAQTNHGATQGAVFR